MGRSAKPFTRWWWFSGPIQHDEIDEQLDWIRDNEFGGVEIAWVYPYPGTPAESGPEFLDEEWQELVRYALNGCRERGLGCDVTFGTLWPFGGTFVPEKYASRTFTGLSPKRITRSWESRYSDKPGLVMDHLNRDAFRHYSSHLLERGFSRFAREYETSFFMDSLELDMEGLSSDTFISAFRESFGYDLDPYTMELDAHEHVRFDYRTLVARLLMEELYIPYQEMCREAGALSRVQCHGALTDLLLAYATADIPETEALLFDPEFTVIPASAAAYLGKPLVSSESFTCLYGWVSVGNDPPGLKKEDPLDIKVQADAQFASGMNQVLWHGMPFSTKRNAREFYATVHVGPEGALAEHIPHLNRYFTTVSEWLRRGTTVSNLAVYLPLEDQWMKGRLPEELHKPSNEYHWELQEVNFPDELLGYRPLWISGGFLPRCRVAPDRPGAIQCGEITVSALYVDAEWVSWDNVVQLLRIAEAGGRIIMNRSPREPGMVHHDEYPSSVERLLKHTEKETMPEPLITSTVPLEFWCRREGDLFIFFFAHPGTKGMRYPLAYRFHETLQEVSVTVELHLDGWVQTAEIPFAPAGSVIVVADVEKRTVDVHTPII